MKCSSLRQRLLNKRMINPYENSKYLSNNNCSSVYSNDGNCIFVVDFRGFGMKISGTASCYELILLYCLCYFLVF